MSELFGLDIGTHSIKAVKVRRDDKGFVLDKVAKGGTPSEAIRSEAEKDKRAISESIKELWQETEMGTANVVASLPESKIFTKVVDFPKMTKKELASALSYEVEKHLPLAIENATYDFDIVSEEDGQMQVLLVAAPNSLINRYVEIIEGAKLHLVALEPEMIASTRALIGAGKDSLPTLLVSMGASTTSLGIVEAGTLRFTRSVLTGGKALERALSQAFGFGEEQAESYKKSYGLAEGKLEGKVADTLRPVFEVIVSEMRKSIDYYRTRGEGKNVERIILSGGSANLPGVLVYLAEEFGLEIQFGNPWERVRIPDSFNREELEEEGVSLGVSIGLALWREGD